jgi:hypothetical protein
MTLAWTSVVANDKLDIFVGRIMKQSSRAEPPENASGHFPARFG